jgi:inorganic pyrophosphatase
MKYLGTVTLETERLILRPLMLDDFNAVHSWASNPENTRLMLWGPNNEEETKSFLSKTTPGKDFAVVLKESGDVIGSCGIYPDADNNNGEVGWILHIDYWRHGYGTEIGGALIKYGFEILSLRRIIAEGAAENYGSRRVMERNGMRQEALYRKAFRIRTDERWVDAIGYAILAEDYFKEENTTAKTEYGFWTAIDKLVMESKIIIDRPKGTKHPRFDFIYPLAYGYLENTSSMDGGGIDVWQGSLDADLCNAVICTVDLLKKDSEIKLLLGCTEEEKEIAMRFHNDFEYMKGVMIRRSL